MKRKLAIALLLTLILAGEGILGASASSQEVSRMTKEELKSKLDSPDVIIIDVRTDRDWDESSIKIKGAVREDPQNAISGMDKYSKNKILVFYCA